MHHNLLISFIFYLCVLPSNVAAENPLLATSSFNWSFAGIGASVKPPGADLLPPDQAYRFSATVIAPNQLRLNWIIASGTYLYKSRLQLSLDNSLDVELEKLILPAGIIKHGAVMPDGEIGDVEVYHDNIDLTVSLLRHNSAATRITLIAKYQGCAEIGVCYPPLIKKVSLELPAAIATTPAVAYVATNAVTSEIKITEQDRLATELRHGTFWGIVATFFGLGLLLAFTPCLFPMIPILSGIIVGHGPNLTTRHAFLVSLIYVLAMSAAYTVAGIVAALFGHNLQAALQNPWVLSSFALLFIALSLSMFGLYDIQLPSSLQTRITGLSNRQHSGNLLGAGIMGLLSALIVGPCVAPPLAGALIYIGQTGNAWLGGTALFALSLGMGTPLLIIGTSAGSLLPRAGAWMNTIKIIFGVLLLGVAITTLERILPAFVIMFLWAILFICIAVFMGALRTQPPNEIPSWASIWQGLGLVILIYGILILIGASAGNDNILMPLRGVLNFTGKSNTEKLLSFKTITTPGELDSALAEAAAQSRPVLLDFYADWCISCKELERYTFTDPQVQRSLERFVLLRADVTANDANAQALLKLFNLPGPPAIIFYNSKSQEIPNLRVVGFITATQLLIHIHTAEQP